MASTPRIPKADITGLRGYVLKRFSHKLFGEVPEPAEVMWHYPARCAVRTCRYAGRRVSADAAIT